MTAFAGVDTSRLLVQAMQVAETNHRIIANNIANVDTPNFNPTHLDFKKTLQTVLDGRGRVSLRKTQPQHFDMGLDRPQFERLALLSKNDYNKVDLDEEMAQLAQNTGRYTIYSSLLAKRFDQLKNMLTALR